MDILSNTGNSHYLVRFAIRTIPGTALIEIVLTGDPLKFKTTKKKSSLPKTGNFLRRYLETFCNAAIFFVVRNSRSKNFHVSHL